MQNFSDFFKLYLERQYFITSATIFNKMLIDLQQQMMEQGNIKSGDEFTLLFGDDDFAEPITIVFYAGYSKRARQWMRDTEGSGTVAIYFADGQYGIETPTIEVYLNQIITDKRVNPFIFIKHMKEPLKSILRHELSHAYEHLVVQRKDQTDTVLNDTGKERQIKDPDERYMNNTSEMNAWFQTWVPTLIDRERLLQHYIQIRDIPKAVTFIINKIQTMPQFEILYDQNKKWFYKTVYTMIDKLIQ